MLRETSGFGKTALWELKNGDNTGMCFFLIKIPDNN
jgi:hypothetical protein